MPQQIIRPTNRPNEEYNVLQVLGKGSFGICLKVANRANELFALKAIEKKTEQNYDVSLFDMVYNRGELTEAEVRLYMIQLIDAISYMHDSNILHRDLKPDNIFMSDDLDLRVGDFGLSTEFTSTDERARTPCGTLPYMAPEMLKPEVGYRYEADIWAIGVIM
ncbi:533_t:CDS:2 [Diversispora eburnea]|uniref:533_t:CDS:1 n=1 Tax=Diversispora eburnea TaxID=1213867 RepID=A0A9N9FMN3_9GLOM|nr:533_t:CDS:2 [Diversispora eburnea]